MADTSVYARLKRLFSTGVIVRNVGGKKLRVADTDNIQALMSNAMRDRYARIYAGSGYGGITPASNYSMNMAYQSQRIMLFRDYDIMDMDSIIHSALDIYADECTVQNEYGRILTVECEDNRIKEILDNLYYDILNLEFNLWMWVRSLCKYGDFFMFMQISPEYGIHNVLPLSVYDTIRLEGLDPNNPYYVVFETMGAGGQKQRLENFEVAHFRLTGDPNFLPYGKSMLEGGRRVYRQLMLMEDAMLIHRIMRAPEKRIFKIDIGNIPPGEIDAYMQRLIDRTKKIPFIDPKSGEYNLRYNMQNILEDFYLPVRGGDSGTEITNLGGLEYNAIDDIQYLLNRLLASLKIPKAFLGYEEGIAGKLTLASEDIRFARTIGRIQRIIESELYKIGVVHLYAQGFKDEALVSFKVSLTMASTIYEQEKINLWKEKTLLARDILDTKLLSTDWIYKNIFNMPIEQYNEQREQIIQDVKRNFRHTQVEQGLSDPQKFGYPQDKPVPPGMEGMQPGAPGGAAGQPALGGGEKGQTLGQGFPEGGMEESAAGRPERGSVPGQDSSALGRDPLGFDERYHAIGDKQERHFKKFPLSFEGKEILKQMEASDKISKEPLKPEILNEGKPDPDKGTFLDENVLD